MIVKVQWLLKDRSLPFVYSRVLPGKNVLRALQIMLAQFLQKWAHVLRQMYQLTSLQYISKRSSYRVRACTLISRRDNITAQASRAQGLAPEHVHSSYAE